MKVSNIQTSASVKFKSLKNPIKPFLMNTKQGNVLISELPVYYLRDDKFLKRILHFFIKNFASNTRDPYWLGYKHPQNRKFMLGLYANYLKPILSKEDGHTTILTAINEEGKLCGACLSYSYDKLPTAKKTTCYIEGLAVDGRYRKCNIGETLLNTTIEANKASFTDVFLKGEKLASGFYKRMNFSVMSLENPLQEDAVKMLASQGEGYPNYVTFFTKPLQQDKQRWYEVFKTWLHS